MHQKTKNPLIMPTFERTQLIFYLKIHKVRNYEIKQAIFFFQPGIITNFFHKMELPTKVELANNKCGCHPEYCGAPFRRT
jgi:hypothetical protein